MAPPWQRYTRPRALGHRSGLSQGRLAICGKIPYFLQLPTLDLFPIIQYFILKNTELHPRAGKLVHTADHYREGSCVPRGSARRTDPDRGTHDSGARGRCKLPMVMIGVSISISPGMQGQVIASPARFHMPAWDRIPPSGKCSLTGSSPLVHTYPSLPRLPPTVGMTLTARPFPYLCHYQGWGPPYTWPPCPSLGAWPRADAGQGEGQAGTWPNTWKMSCIE